MMCETPFTCFVFIVLPSLFCPSLSEWINSALLRQQEHSRIHQGAGRNTLHSRKALKKRSILWAEWLGQGCGCFVEAAWVWHFSHTACRDFTMWQSNMVLFYAGKMSNSIWGHGAPHRGKQNLFHRKFYCRQSTNLPQSSSVSTLLKIETRNIWLKRILKVSKEAASLQFEKSIGLNRGLFH